MSFSDSCPFQPRKTGETNDCFRSRTWWRPDRNCRHYWWRSGGVAGSSHLINLPSSTGPRKGRETQTKDKPYPLNYTANYITGIIISVPALNHSSPPFHHSSQVGWRGCRAWRLWSRKSLRLPVQRISGFTLVVKYRSLLWFPANFQVQLPVPLRTLNCSPTKRM